MNKLLIVLAILIALGAALFLSKKTPPESVNQIFPKTNQNTNTPVTNNTDLQIPEDFSGQIFAQKISGTRNLEFSPGGTLLVSQPSQGKIVALTDPNNDGISDEQKTVVSGLDNPHGFAFFNQKLYVAEEEEVSRYDWDESAKKAAFEKKLFNLPKGGRHSTRTITFTKDGKMFVSIGSTCDVCLEKNEQVAAIITSNSEGETPRVYAKGLRNAVFTTINPKTQKLWSTEMGRDFLGDNLPPDEINLIEEGKDYGWPICYGDKVHDANFDKNQYTEDPCANTVAPEYKIPAHSAPLGLAFVESKQFPQDWQDDLLVSYHGSWNSTTPKGYKVVRIKMENGKAQGEEDFLTGFIKDGQVNSRPVDLVFDAEGALFVSDDKLGTIYKISGQN